MKDASTRKRRPDRPEPQGSGQVWVISLLALPVASALVGSSVMVDWSASSWRWRNVLWIVLGAGVPLGAALNHTRALGVLLVTLLAAATTYPAAKNLVEGEHDGETTLRDSGCAVYARRGTRCIEHRLVLADGRDVTAEAELVKPLGNLRTGERLRVVSVAGVAVRLEKR